MRRSVVLVSFSALVLTGWLAACDDEDGEDLQRWTTILGGQNEVPPQTTDATGAAHFEIDGDGDDHIHFEVEVTNIQDVTMGHIHAGAAGANGPVVVTLLMPSPAEDVPGSKTYEGEFDEGDIMPNTANVTTLAQLIQLMDTGGAYVNVHTTGKPGGEIRGQLAIEP